MKIHLRFYPTEQNGFAPIKLEINPFKYPFNSLEDRYEYGHFSKEEVTKKHREIVEYIDERLKAQPLVAEQTNNRVECILRPVMEDEFYTSNGDTLIIRLLVPINNTMMDLSAFLGDYSNYTTYGLVKGQWHNPNIDSLAKIGLIAADSALLKSRTAVDSALSYMDSAKKQVKFLNSPNRYSVSDKKNRDELLESLSKKYTYVNDSVKECQQVVSLLDTVAHQITTDNRGPRSRELADKKLLQGKQHLNDSLKLLEELKNLIESSKQLINTLLEELSSDPIKQEQVNQWLLQKLLEARKNAIYSRLDESKWINLDEKSLSEIEEMIVQFNVIKQDMTELNITGHWINAHKLLTEALAMKKIEKINKELVFFDQFDFSQNNSDPELHARVANIEENINQRDVALQSGGLTASIAAEDGNQQNYNRSSSNISLDRNIDEQQSFIKKAANAVRQFITWVLSSIEFILLYPLSWIYGEQKQSEQQPYNNTPSSVQSQQEQRVKSTTITQQPTFTPLMLARAQRELARKNAIANDSRNPIIGLENNLERPVITPYN